MTKLKNSHQSNKYLFLPQRVGFVNGKLSYDYMGSAEYEFGAGFITHVALGQMIRDEAIAATTGVKIDFKESYGAGDPKREPEDWICFHSIGFEIDNPLNFGRTKENPFRSDTKLIICYSGKDMGKDKQALIDAAPKLFFIRGDLLKKELDGLLKEFQAKCLRAATNFDNPPE